MTLLEVTAGDRVNLDHAFRLVTRDTDGVKSVEIHFVTGLVKTITGNDNIDRLESVLTGKFNSVPVEEPPAGKVA